MSSGPKLLNADGSLKIRWVSFTALTPEITRSTCINLDAELGYVISVLVRSARCFPTIPPEKEEADPDSILMFERLQKG